MRRIATAMLLIMVAIAAGVAGSHLRGAGHAAARAQGELREFTLVAEPVKWEIQPGLVVDGWGYNGQIPGPTLRVTEGDLVRIHLINHLPAPTTIHWHGIDVPLAMDGVPGLSQEQVEPDESFVYEFVATNPGTRWYHTHVDSNLQTQLGLFGAFIIDPRVPAPVTYDRDFTYILSEKALDVTPQVALGEADIRHRDAGNGRGGAFQFDLFLMNGKAGAAVEPLSIAAGERIRIRLINAGSLVHAIHLHGHSFKIIATDGNPVPPAAQLLKDTVLIGPSERYDLEVDGTNAGIWLFHCHMNNHMENGMATVLAYDGAQPLAGSLDHGHHGGAVVPPTATATAGTRPASTPPVGAGGAGAATTTAPGTTLTMLDNRYSPSRLTVPAGTTLTWTNTGSNLHTTTSLDALWDSGSLAHDERFSFTFNTPGTYQFLCRQHFFQGMRGVITVVAP